MGKIDVAIYEYISDKTRIADLFNGVYFDGMQAIRAEDIEDYEEKYPLKKKASGGKKGRRGNARYRDIVKKWKIGGTLRVLAIENQNFVDYTMPFRCMEYDTLEYRRQIDDKRKENYSVAKWNNRAEFLCGVHREDRFSPVYTICLYHGKEVWDGPRTLKDMMDFGRDENHMSRFFSDYPMKLFCVNEENNFECFQTELREFFQILSCREDTGKLEKLSKMERYQNISRETAEMIAIVLGWSETEKSNMEYKEEGKGVNMCKAMEELLKREREIGEKTGIEQGIELTMCDMALKMWKAGINWETICQITGKTTEEMQKILEGEMQDETKVPSKHATI